MSITTITALEVARREPRRRAVGATSLSATLSATVPTGLVAAYTAFTTAIVAVIEDQGGTDQLLGWRWGSFVVLVVATVAITAGTYRSKRTDEMPELPWLSLAATAVAAVGWGLALPQSPLAAQLDGSLGIVVPLAIASLAVVVNLVIASFINTHVDD